MTYRVGRLSGLLPTVKLHKTQRLHINSDNPHTYSPNQTTPLAAIHALMMKYGNMNIGNKILEGARIVIVEMIKGRIVLANWWSLTEMGVGKMLDGIDLIYVHNIYGCNHWVFYSL